MLTIGKLATLAHVTPDTQRYYERQGLIEPSRTFAGGFRLYGDDDVARLRFIRQSKDWGFTLAKIRALPSLSSRKSARGGDVRVLAEAKNRQLRVQIEAMCAMTRTLDQLIGTCDHTSRPAGQCPILQTLHGAASKPSKR